MGDTKVNNQVAASKGRKGLVCFIIFAGVSFTLLLSGLLFLLVDIPDLASYPPFVTFFVKYIFSIALLIGGVVFLVLSIVNFLKFRKGKSAMDVENRKKDEKELRLSITNKKKFKIITLIVGGSLLLFGLVTMVTFNYAVPSVVVGVILMIVGAISLLMGLFTKVKKAAHSGIIKRKQEGQYLYITYPTGDNWFKGQEFIEIYQDCINDGFTEFISYDYKKKLITFKTNLNLDELQAQYLRREAYLSKSKRRSIVMPSYFSEEPTVSFNENNYQVPPYTRTEDYWEKNRVEVGTRVKRYSDGSEIKTPITELRWFYFHVLREYRESGTIYTFFHTDGKPLTGTDGVQIEVDVHRIIISRSEKLDNGVMVSGKGVYPGK